MQNNDIADLYQMAAQGTTEAPAAEQIESIKDASFKLQSCMTWTRVLLKDAGFETAQIISEEWPELRLSVVCDGNAHNFRLCIPKAGQDAEGQPLFGKTIVLAGNADGSISSFNLHEEDGSFLIGRFDTLSKEIARHLATECGKKAAVQARMALSV